MQTNYEERLISSGLNSGHWKFHGARWFLPRANVTETKACVGQRGRITAWFKFAGGASGSKKPRSSCSSFHFLFFLPFADSDAALEFPFKVGQRPLSLFLFPILSLCLSTSLCLPGTVPYVIPIQSASVKKKKARDETLVLWFYLLRFKLISSFPLWLSSQSSSWCLLCFSDLPKTYPFFPLSLSVRPSFLLFTLSLGYPSLSLKLYMKIDSNLHLSDTGFELSFCL